MSINSRTEKFKNDMTTHQPTKQPANPPINPGRHNSNNQPTEEQKNTSHLYNAVNTTSNT